MVQINSSSSSRKRRNQGSLCLAYVLIGLYIFYFFSESESDTQGLGNSAPRNKAHKVDASFASAREKLLSIVNDPERINKATSLQDSKGNPVDPKKIAIDNNTYKFPESGHAHKLLDGMLGIEIGARSYQGFGLTTLNVDYLPITPQQEQEDSSDGHDIAAAKEETKNEVDRQLELAGIVRQVDVILSDNLPFNDGALDFVLVNRQSDADPFTWDPILSFCEWGRVVKDGGYLYVILPNKQHTFWHREKESTTIQEVVAAHMKHVKSPSDHVDDPILWDDNDASEFLWYMGLNVVDSLVEHDSVQGGHAVVIRVERKNGMVSSRC